MRLGWFGAGATAIVWTAIGCGARSDLLNDDYAFGTAGSAGNTGAGTHGNSGGSSGQGAGGSSAGGPSGGTDSGTGGSPWWTGGTASGAVGAVGAGGGSYGGEGDGSGGYGAQAGSGGTSCMCAPPEPVSCTTVHCDEALGLCVTEPAANGSGCDDDDFCTLGETCADGVCGGGQPNTCGLVADDCSSIKCNASAKSCALKPLNGNACSLSDPCQVNGKCSGGTCKGSPKDCSGTYLPNECYVAECNAQNGACQALPTSGGGCTDPFDLCSVGKTCQSGVCSGGTAKDCSSFDGVCTTGVCDEGDGLCSAQFKPSGTSCDDGNACTSNDGCSGSSCVGSPINTCTSGDTCCPQGCTIGNDDDCQPKQIILHAVNRGWWNGAGDHTSINDNTYTGYYGGLIYNSYFSFDLSSVVGTVLSAQLVLEQEWFFGSDLFETASIWDVSTPAPTLEATGNNVGIFTDLQTGNSYGTFVGLSTDTGINHVTDLSAQAVSDINAALGGDFSVGVHIDSLSYFGYSEGLRFSSYDEQRVHELVLTVQ